MDFANRLQSAFADYAISRLTAFMSANLIDKTDGNIPQIRKAFHQITDKYGDFETYYLVDRIAGNSFAPESISRRLAQLDESGLSDAEITEESTPLRNGYGYQFPVIETLPAGVYVKVLYTDKALRYTDKMIKSLHLKESAMTKVQLSDNVIGWVPSGNLKYVRKDLFQEDKAAVPTWTTEYANHENNLLFEGPRIRTPKVTKILDGYSTAGMRFVDINADHFVDLIFDKPDAMYNYSIVGLDGENQQKFWDLEAYSSILTGYAIADGKFFMSAHPDEGLYPIRIRAYDLQTGSPIWEYEDASRYNLNLLYFDRKLYAVPNYTSVIAIDAESGELAWRASAGTQSNDHHIHFTTHMAVNRNALVLASEDSLFAFDPQTGESIWRIEMTIRRIRFQPPVLDDEHAFVSSAEWLNAVNLQDGTIDWQVDIRNVSLGQVVVTDDKLICTRGGAVLGLDKISGDLLWRYEFGYLAWRMVADREWLYIKGKRNREGNALIIALDQSNGDFKWEYPIPTPALNNPILYQSGKLFLNGYSGVIVIEDSSAATAALTNLPKFELLQNYPNPFNATTTVSFRLHEAQNVSLNIYNILGKRVRNLADGFHYRGHYKLRWDGQNERGTSASSGIYFYQLKIGGENQVRPMLFVK